MASAFKFNRGYYKWQPTPDGGQLIRSNRVVAEVMRDLHYPSMYRIKIPGMAASDTINLARAKDAALSLADASLDGRMRVAEAPSNAPNAEASPAEADGPNVPATTVSPPRRGKEGGTGDNRTDRL